MKVSLILAIVLLARGAMSIMEDDPERPYSWKYDDKGRPYFDQSIDAHLEPEDTGSENTFFSGIASVLKDKFQFFNDIRS